MTLGCIVGATLAPVDYDEYAYSESKRSPKQISLEFGLSTDRWLKPGGYVIYRKAEGGKYKRIKKLNTKKWWVTYTDKTVKPGTMYYYKVRAFRKVGKKMLHSSTNPLYIGAVNLPGKFTLKTMTPENKEAKEIVLRMTSAKYNGLLDMRRDEGQNSKAYYVTQDGEHEKMVLLELAEISSDGKQWEAISEEDPLKLRPGETLHLKYRFTGTIITDFETEDQTEENDLDSFVFTPSAEEDVGFRDYGFYDYYSGFTARYASLSSVMNIDLKTQSMTVGVDVEMYH